MKSTEGEFVRAGRRLGPRYTYDRTAHGRRRRTGRAWRQLLGFVVVDIDPGWRVVWRPQDRRAHALDVAATGRRRAR